MEMELTYTLKCKCTQSSIKMPCKDGVCEVPDESACLMLDHPLSGRHYACSTKEMKEGECTVRTSKKSGSTVKVCSCNSSDLCNFKFWPALHSDDLGNDEEDTDEWKPIQKNQLNADTNTNKGVSIFHKSLVSLVAFPIMVLVIILI